MNDIDEAALGFTLGVAPMGYIAAKKVPEFIHSRQRLALEEARLPKAKSFAAKSKATAAVMMAAAGLGTVNLLKKYANDDAFVGAGIAGAAGAIGANEYIKRKTKANDIQASAIADKLKYVDRSRRAIGLGMASLLAYGAISKVEPFARLLLKKASDNTPASPSIILGAAAAGAAGSAYAVKSVNNEVKSIIDKYNSDYSKKLSGSERRAVNKVLKSEGLKIYNDAHKQFKASKAKDVSISDIIKDNKLNMRNNFATDIPSKFGTGPAQVVQGGIMLVPKKVPVAVFAHEFGHYLSGERGTGGPVDFAKRQRKNSSPEGTLKEEFRASFSKESRNAIPLHKRGVEGLKLDLHAKRTYIGSYLAKGRIKGSKGVALLNAHNSVIGIKPRLVSIAKRSGVIGAGAGLGAGALSAVMFAKNNS